jgi:hypothetical protein
MSNIHAKVSAHRVAVLTIIKILQEDRCSSVTELCEETGMARSSTLTWVAEMLRMEMIHISEWRRTRLNNPCIPCYKWGKGKNARKPAKLSDKFRARTYRQRKLVHTLADALTRPITDPSRIDSTEPG